MQRCNCFSKTLVPWTKVIYKHAKLNTCKQEAHKTVYAFVTYFHSLANTYEYKLKQKLTCARLIVGLADMQLSEKLQLKAELTLESSITTACNRETTKQQQKMLRLQLLPPAAADTKRGFLKSKGKPKHYSRKDTPDQTQPLDKQCTSAMHTASYATCPANGKTCGACSKKRTLYAYLCKRKARQGHTPSCIRRGLFGRTSRLARPQAVQNWCGHQWLTHEVQDK